MKNLLLLVGFIFSVSFLSSCAHKSHHDGKDGSCSVEGKGCGKGSAEECSKKMADCCKGDKMNCKDGSCDVKADGAVAAPSASPAPAATPVEAPAAAKKASKKSKKTK